MMHCQQFLDDVSDLLDGDLAPDTAEAARQHAASCAGCGAVLASSRQMLGWMGDGQNFAMPAAASIRLRESLKRRLSPEPNSPAPPRRRVWGSFWLQPRWAAALVLIVLVAGLARWRADATTVSGWLIDQDCAVSFQGHPADHTVACLRHCVAKGVALGLLDTQGRFRPFDAHGEQSARTVIATTHKADDVWVTVKARPAGHGVLDVEQIALSTPPN